VKKERPDGRMGWGNNRVRNLNSISDSVCNAKRSVNAYSDDG
jgi:hypothetical protein